MNRGFFRTIAIVICATDLVYALIVLTGIVRYNACGEL
jgi:hypothetical protein